MRRAPLWLVLIGSAIVIVGVLVQAFTIAAFVRGAGTDALDAHQTGSIFVHFGELAVVVGAIWAWWRNWNAIGLAIAFLGLSFAQLAFIGNTDEQGGWINGLHGFLALVLLLAASAYLVRARRELGLGSAAVTERSRY